MAYRKVSDDSLTAVADAIRGKGGTSAQLTFPEGFVSAIGAIEAGDPFGAEPAFDYTVSDIDGVTCGFALNDAGFYESTNRKQSNSYSLCRVNFTVRRACDIVFDVINYAEANYDYGLFSSLDSSLGLSVSVDTAGVHRSFKSEHSADVVQLTYSGVTAGSHFIDVKFIKDGSNDSNNDSLQFRVQQVGGLSQETIDKILAAEPDIAPENIRAGVDVFGVVGTLEGAADPVLQARTATPSESAQEIVPDSGYDGLSRVTVGAISATYVGSGVTRRSATTITPGTSSQVISAGQYLSGAQTIRGDANLVPENIKSGVSIFGVAGSLEGGGGNFFATEATLASDYTTKTGRVLCSIPYIGEHIDDAGLFVLLLRRDATEMTLTVPMVAACNSAYLNSSYALAVQRTQYGASVAYKPGGADGYQLNNSSASDMPRVYADSSGNVYILPYGSYAFAAGTYSVIYGIL